ncbi:hypothetical protein PtA15_3A464 [Puccinia triticina]|uniref:methylisocitrate lyase n=1 Tax=Puccinia triticina TaxID=208348 RepID=A0ABY7CJW1_9BASI|nr:uncharacterized protein PtA15_3A464 [Puccinia triticina]WAQ83097.1 hypothetical protein PtA15_3A464 [Puccinia triticina]WAR53936.1 hypothetical protein PtB15_3B445 [Puccinia triticina]
MQAARMQWDIMDLKTLLIGQTKAESAKLISSNHDPCNHCFILGFQTAQPHHQNIAWAKEIIQAEERGALGNEINEMKRWWTKSVELITL